MPCARRRRCRCLPGQLRSGQFSLQQPLSCSLFLSDAPACQPLASPKHPEPALVCLASHLPHLPFPQKLAGDLSLAALWETYQATLSAPAELTADGTAQRSLGGKFIKLAKKRIQAEKMQCVRAVGFLAMCACICRHAPAAQQAL